MSLKLYVAVLSCLPWMSTAEASTQANIVQIVQQAPTVTYLQAPTKGALAVAGTTLNLKVVSPTGLTVPNGAVVVTDGSISIGSFPLTNGVATASVSLSSIGTHQLTACYVASANFSASCSSPVDFNSLAPYTLQQGKTSGVIEAPIPFVDKLEVIPINGFVGVVQLACQVPAYACNLSSSSVTFTGNGQPQVVEASFVPSTATTLASFIGLPILGLVGFRRRRRCRLATILSVLAGAGMLLGLTGCGPIVSVPFNSANYTMLVNSSSGIYSQAVTYEIQVDATGPKQ
jgi:Bacterial Ig-like domain (group 3)